MVPTANERNGAVGTPSVAAIGYLDVGERPDLAICRLRKAMVPTANERNGAVGTPSVAAIGYLDVGERPDLAICRQLRFRDASGIGQRRSIEP